DSFFLFFAEIKTHGSAGTVARRAKDFKMDIVLIGSGNVATQLGRALRLKGHRIVQVYSRNRSHAEDLASTLNAMHGSIDGDNETDLRTETVATYVLAELHREAAFYFICVSDQHIQEVIAGLPANLNGV